MSKLHTYNITYNYFWKNIKIHIVMRPISLNKYLNTKVITKVCKYKRYSIQFAEASYAN